MSAINWSADPTASDDDTGKIESPSACFFGTTGAPDTTDNGDKSDGMELEAEASSGRASGPHAINVNATINNRIYWCLDEMVVVVLYIFVFVFALIFLLIQIDYCCVFNLI